LWLLFESRPDQKLVDVEPFLTKIIVILLFFDELSSGPFRMTREEYQVCQHILIAETEGHSKPDSNAF
jgi:hypothetical protein